jgi:hypothetical protein
MKKTKGRELTPEQKRNNKKLFVENIGVAHNLGDIKVFRVVHDIFHNFCAGFDDLVMGNCLWIAQLSP